MPDVFVPEFNLLLLGVGGRGALVVFHFCSFAVGVFRFCQLTVRVAHGHDGELDLALSRAHTELDLSGVSLLRGFGLGVADQPTTVQHEDVPRFFQQRRKLRRVHVTYGFVVLQIRPRQVHLYSGGGVRFNFYCSKNSSLSVNGKICVLCAL